MAFVLSGGANLGAAQAGMLEALLNAGIVPDLLVGTSIGAVNAAFMAAGPTPDRARALSEIWRRLSAEEIFPLRAAQVTRAILAGGLFSPAPLRRMLEREIPFRLIEEAVTPLRIVATRCERRADGSRSLRFLAAGLDRRAGQATAGSIWDYRHRLRRRTRRDQARGPRSAARRASQAAGIERNLFAGAGA